MPEPLKSFVNRESVGRLAGAIQLVHPAFDSGAFAKAATTGLEPLELKARVDHVAAAVAAHLPQPFPKGARLLARAVPKAVPELTMWEAWPAVTYVEHRGIEHPLEALEALAVLTRYASAEFAIRPYIEQHPDVTWPRLHAWAESGDLHVRRLVSEGTRPRLPWGRQLPSLRQDPSPSLALLDRLRDDPDEYVRRSVANHLNDVAKDHAELAIATARRWLAAPSEHTERIVRHALRSLIKAGHPDALTLLGSAPDSRLAVGGLRIHMPVVTLGESLHFSFTLTSTADEPIRAVIDYVVHHRRANGALTPKVFKLSTRMLVPSETAAISRHHPMRPITTRRYYPGEHKLEVQINGRVLACAAFQLRV